MSPNEFCGGISFRIARPPDWTSPRRDDAAALARSWVQYRLASRVWAAVNRGTITLKSVAAITGKTSETLRRKLVGDEYADSGDLALWFFLGDPRGDPGEGIEVFPPAVQSLLRSWSPGDGVPVWAFRDAAPVDWTKFSEALASLLDQYAKGGFISLIDDGGLRFACVTTLVESGFDPLEIATEGMTLVLGAPGRVQIGVADVRRGQAHDRHGDDEVLAQIEHTIMTLSASSVPSRVLVVLTDRRGSVVTRHRLPGASGQEVVVGPIESDADRGAWRQITTTLRGLTTHPIAGGLSLELVQVEKAHIM